MLNISQSPGYNNVFTKIPAQNRAKQTPALSFAGFVKAEPQKVWDIFEEITKIYRETSTNGKFIEYLANNFKEDSLKQVKEIVETTKQSGSSKEILVDKLTKAGLTPKQVEDITKLYDGLENSKEISNYLTEKLKKAGFEVEQVKDGIGKYNVYATRSLNKNKDNAVVIQAHLDMVCISDDKNPKKPIEMTLDGDFLKANNRTLGADDGIGLAIALAIAENPKFKDLPLQIIFTVDEEDGMYGAKALKTEDLHGKYVVSIDSGKLGKVTIGCAGTDRFEGEKEIPMVSVGNNSHIKVILSLKDATGGHSGLDINKGRLNPIKAVLEELNNYTDVKLISVVGGEKFNSIPRDVTVEMLIPEAQSEGIIPKLASFLDNIKETYKNTDPVLKTKLKFDNNNVPGNTPVLQKDFQDKFLRILGKELHVGMKSVYNSENVRTSQNLGVVNLKNGRLSLGVMLRSADATERQEVFNKNKAQISELFGTDYKVKTASAPIWQPNYNSAVAKLAIEAYKNLGIDSSLRVSHGSIENSRFVDTKPGIDQISLLPIVLDEHGISESVQVSSVDKFYKFMESLLQSINDNLIKPKHPD